MLTYRLICPTCGFLREAECLKEIQMIKVIKIDTEGGICPYQVEGWTDDECPVYVRYRHGYLRVEVGKPGSVNTRWQEDTVFQKTVTKENDGYMTYSELREHTAGVIEWVDYPNAQENEPKTD